MLVLFSAKKSRTALVELPSYQKTSEAESENEEEIEETYSGRSPTIPTGRRTKKRRQTAVIDLEKEPEGLKDVRYCNYALVWMIRELMRVRNHEFSKVFRASYGKNKRILSILTVFT